MTAAPSERRGGPALAHAQATSPRPSARPARAGQSFAGVVFLLAALAGSPAAAHKGSDSYWSLTVSGAALEGHLDVPVRDLDAAHGLDGDGDGAVTWGELSARDEALRAWARQGLSVSEGEADCPLELGALAVIRHSDGVYASWPVRATCPAPVGALRAGYQLLFDVDAQHRGLLRVGGGEWVAFSAAERTRSLAVARPPASQVLGTAFREGVHHLAIGWDHLCFLFALLLPSVLRREGGAWVPTATLRGTLLDVAKVVTAFTVAHSITLGLAAFGVLSPNPAFVEVAIAGSVVLAALNTTFPVVTEGRWTLAFGLGLLHGFGFVSALKDLGASGGQLALSLLGFNLGVEAGQLLVVAAFVPLAFLLRTHRLYAARLVPLGGLGLAALALWWTVDRVAAL